MLPEAVDLFSVVKQAHANTYQQLQILKRAIAKTGDIKELCDVVYALKEALKFAEDIEREVQSLEQVSVKITCGMWVQLPGDPAPIKTDYCTGSPDVKMIASCPSPKRDPANYDKLMQHLGVPRHLYEMGLGEEAEGKRVVDLFWPGLVDYVTNELTAGRPQPPGLDMTRTFPKYVMACRGRKGVDAEQVA